MKEGTKSLVLHSIHTFIVLLAMLVSIILGPCFGFDHADYYICFYRNGDHTLLFYFYVWPLMIFIFLLIPFGAISVIPYILLSWIKHFQIPGIDNLKKRIWLTVFSLLLIIIHPLWTFLFSDLIMPYLFWTMAILTIIISTYYLPYAFIRLSYPNLSLLPKYRAYKAALTSQLIVYLLLLIYVISPLPEVLSEYIDSKYLHWLHR
ncbi:hypothetical protein ACFL5K_04335 [Gemmatimonadota bacterium]